MGQRVSAELDYGKGLVEIIVRDLLCFPESDISGNIKPRLPRMRNSRISVTTAGTTSIPVVGEAPRAFPNISTIHSVSL